MSKSKSDSSRTPLSRTSDEKSLESVSGRKVLTGLVEVDTTQRQFPIPVKKSKTRGKSSKKRKKTKEDLLTTGPASLYGNWRCLLLDRHQIEASMIKRYRVQGKKDSPCYIYNEMHKYDNNTFYRNLLIGSFLGASIYFVTLIFVILPETNEKFTPFKDQKFAIAFIPVVLLAIVFIFLLRFCYSLYFSPYLIAFFQVGILVVAIMGNLDNECRRDLELSDRNLTMASMKDVPMTGAGQLPVFAMACVESICSFEDDPLRKALLLVRCDQSLRKYCAINLLSELVNLIISIRLMLV